MRKNWKRNKRTTIYLFTVLMMISLVVVILSACTKKNDNAYIYKDNAGDEIQLSVHDESNRYEVKGKEETFTITDKQEDIFLIHGVFEDEKKWAETIKRISKTPACAILDQSDQMITWLSYGEQGWETSRMFNIPEGEKTLIISSLSSEIKSTVGVFDSLSVRFVTAEKTKSIIERKLMGIPFVILLSVLAGIVVVIIVLFWRMHKKRMHFEYYYEEQEMHDKEVFSQQKTSSVDDEEKTVYMFSGKTAKQTSKRTHLLKLYTTNESGITYTIELDKPKLIGRSRSSSDIVIAGDNTITRKHCEVKEEAGKIVIRDCESANGTWVNGERILKECTLNTGDILKLGNTEFKIEVT